MRRFGTFAAGVFLPVFSCREWPWRDQACDRSPCRESFE